jgi:hypothetical protein
MNKLAVRAAGLLSGIISAYSDPQITPISLIELRVVREISGSNLPRPMPLCYSALGMISTAVQFLKMLERE